MWFRVPEYDVKEPDDDSYYEVELTAPLRDQLYAFLKGSKLRETSLKLILCQLERARKVDLPLPVQLLDWSLAAQRGESEVDLVWDGAGKPASYR